jgi:predicted nucleic acid-binding protein
MIVVDASVAAKWLLPEAGSEAALQLVAGCDRLVAPALIRLEVLAAITRRVRKGLATPSESRERCAKWLGYLEAGTIAVVPEEAVLNQAVEAAITLKHTLQDCLYLATAQQLDARLITADRPFYERAKMNFPAIQLLVGCEAN